MLFLVVDSEWIVALDPLTIDFDAAGNLVAITIIPTEAMLANATPDRRQMLSTACGELVLNYQNGGLHHVCPTLKRAQKWIREIARSTELKFFWDTVNEIIDNQPNSNVIFTPKENDDLVPKVSRTVFTDS